MAPFDLVFADPPYGKGLGERSLASLRQGDWLRPDALIVLEERADATVDLPAGFTLLDRRQTGDTALHFISAQGSP